jgi:5-methylcytosine-specific restriction endonuclease McrA
MTREQRLKIFQRDNYTCKKCGKLGTPDSLQVAHKIRKGVGTLNYICKYLRCTKIADKFIKEKIINHDWNLETACCLECNASFNIFFNKVECNKLLEKILKDLKINT